MVGGEGIHTLLEAAEALDGRGEERGREEGRGAAAAATAVDRLLVVGLRDASSPPSADADVDVNDGDIEMEMEMEIESVDWRGAQPREDEGYWRGRGSPLFVDEEDGDEDMGDVSRDCSALAYEDELVAVAVAVEEDEDEDEGGEVSRGRHGRGRGRGRGMVGAGEGRVEERLGQGQGQGRVAPRLRMLYLRSVRVRGVDGGVVRRGL